jgi:hypothetical protein
MQAIADAYLICPILPCACLLRHAQRPTEKEHEAQ